MDLERLSLALQGMGAGFTGQSPAPYIQAAKALPMERKRAMAQDAQQALQLVQSGDTGRAKQLLTRRVDLIKQLGGDPKDTMEVLSWMENGEWDRVMEDLGSTVQMAQQTGLLEGPRQVGTAGGQVIVQNPDGSFQAITPEGYDPSLSGGEAKYGLTPTFVQGPDGQTRVVQLSSQGGAKPVDLPEGWRVVDPYGKAYMSGRGSGDARIQTEQQMTPVLADQAAATTVATNRANAATVGDVEAAKLEGRGEVPEKQKQYNAKKRVTGNLKQMAKYYHDLNKVGGIVNTEKGALSNLSASLRSSVLGQAVGRRIGSEEQAIRDKINAMRPTLVNDIRQAAEMGAKGMDSEKELEFFLQAATDPNRIIQTNMAALEVINRAYGLGKPLPGIKEDALNSLLEEADSAMQQGGGQENSQSDSVIEVDF